MSSPYVFDRVHHDNHPNAVTVHIWSRDGKLVGEVSWPPVDRGGTILRSAVGEPVPAEMALRRAVAEAEAYGFPRVVVHIDDLRLWNDAWGRLRE